MEWPLPPPLLVESQSKLQALAVTQGSRLRVRPPEPQSLSQGPVMRQLAAPRPQDAFLLGNPLEIHRVRQRLARRTDSSSLSSLCVSPH